MPSPLGHAAFGLAVHELQPKGASKLGPGKTFVLVSVLANFPDIDVLLGLIFWGNGGAFHRGITHSIVFALVTSLFLSNSWRCWSRIPKLGFLWCFCIITSHLLTDAIFSSSPVSLLWPFERHNTAWYCDWNKALQTFLHMDLKHFLIILGCGVLIGLLRVIKDRRFSFPFSYPSKISAGVRPRH